MPTTIPQEQQRPPDAPLGAAASSRARSASIGAKLLAICLAFCLPLALLGALLLADRQRLRADALAELEGVQALAPLRAVREALLEARAAGDDGQPDLAAEIDALLASSGPVAARPDLDRLREHVQRFAPRLADPARADRAAAQLLTRTNEATRQVGMRTQLLLDDDPETYWLLHQLVVTLPTLDALRAELVEVARGVTDRAALLPHERADLIALRAQIDRALTELEAGYAAAEQRRSGRIDPAVATARDAVLASDRALRSTVTDRVLTPPQPARTAGRLRTLDSAARTASLALADATALSAAALLAERVEGLDRGTAAWAMAILAVLALTGAVVSRLARSIRGPLREAAEAARRIRSGELDADIPSHSGDEVGQLLDAMSDLTGYLRDMALLDPLTGLANRTLFTDRLQQATSRLERGAAGVGVLFCDLDHFKDINDTLGHAAGDDLLRGVADRLTASVRPSDTLARFGGDEFTVLLEDLGSVAEAVSTAERVEQAMRRPFPIAGRELHVSTSVGIAYTDRPGALPGDLLRDADVALYRSKAEGRARHTVFVEHMAADALEDLRLDSELRRATERGELRLFFQPEVNLATGAIVGAEALVRWERPDHGLVAPESFIAAAEANGAILPIGAWVLEQACEWAVRWQAATGASPFVAVNLSPRQFRAEGLVDDVATALKDSGLAPRCLRLEITEGSIMDDTEQAIDLLVELRDLGVGLAIDDFGTGYSSLNYLQQLPVDVVKIDRTFIAGIDTDQKTRMIVGSVVRLAKALGLAATAEGVETAGQRDVLRGVGCRWGQGFLFSRPVPAPVSVDLLREWDGGVGGRVPRPASRPRRAAV